MPSLRFPIATRVAIWRAHSQKCAYCGDFISYAELDIDHVIPETLTTDPAEFERVKADFGVVGNFGINSVQNLLPAHRHCNRIKSNRIFNPSRARFFLEVASSKESAVRRHIASLQLQNQKEQVLVAIQNAFETGVIKLDEVTNLNSESRFFPLTRSLEFVDGSLEGAVRQEDLDRLLDKPLLIGGTSTIDGLKFVNDSGSSIVIRTCREYRSAIAAGFYGPTNFDIKMGAFFRAADAVINAVAHAQIATVSFVSNPFVGVADLRLLPKTVLPRIGPDSDSELLLPVNSLRELALRNEIQVRDVSSNRLRFEWDSAGAVLIELLRADLDGDGLEEVLIQHITYAVGGTLEFDSVGILRRLGPDEMFEFIPQP